MCITFWFHVYSVIKVFSFSTTSVERFSGLGEDFVFNYIFPVYQYQLLTNLILIFFFFANGNQVFLKYLKFKFTLFICIEILMVNEILTAYTFRKSNMFTHR